MYCRAVINCNLVKKKMTKLEMQSCLTANTKELVFGLKYSLGHIYFCSAVNAMFCGTVRLKAKLFIEKHFFSRVSFVRLKAQDRNKMQRSANMSCSNVMNHVRSIIEIPLSASIFHSFQAIN